MGKHARLLQPLEMQAEPLRWLLLETFAREYPELMGRLNDVRVALEACLDAFPSAREDEYQRSMLIESAGMQISYKDLLTPYVNAWGIDLGFSSSSQVTPEFLSWLYAAAVQCSMHPMMQTKADEAVIQTAREEGLFSESHYEEQENDPRPEPPEFDPDLVTRPEYMEQVESYMEQAEAWYERHGAVRMLARDPKAMKAHLSWIVWSLADCLTDEQVAERYRESGGPAIGSDTIAALYRPKGLATLLGLRRNQKTGF